MKGEPHKLVFVSGTDTGVGKTLFSCLFLAHLQERQGGGVRAVKPLASGSRSDAQLLRRFHRSRPPLAAVNPWYFKAPLAPAMAAQLERRRIRQAAVSEWVRRQRLDASCLIVEGAGGLLVPAGQGFQILDLMAGLGPDLVVLVGRNALGTINHCLLSWRALQASLPATPVVFVLMSPRKPDASTPLNARVLGQETGAPVHTLPFLAQKPASLHDWPGVKKNIQKTLAAIEKFGSLSARFGPGKPLKPTKQPSS